ncbi:hypothetical protein SAY87_016263 [Trapa incisa]|uniref:Uncharacterized protein n=1 Tax=Trapa incisa TaxID=236973 RepID=A0AAN7LH52_9MYRT|nr:hypothetical protein SAY87_016263 [Trapa incisa]
MERTEESHRISLSLPKGKAWLLTGPTTYSSPIASGWRMLFTKLAVFGPVNHPPGLAPTMFRRREAGHSLIPDNRLHASAVGSRTSSFSDHLHSSPAENLLRPEKLRLSAPGISSSLPLALSVTNRNLHDCGLLPYFAILSR